MPTLYEVRPREHLRAEIISDSLPFRCALWCGLNGVKDALEYAKFHSRSSAAVILVYDEAGKVVETHKHKGEFDESQSCASGRAPCH